MADVRKIGQNTRLCLITFVITAFNFITWAKLFPRQFSDERWTVGREILLITGNILLIAIANRLYLEWLLNSEGYANAMSWPGMILSTFLLGAFPTTGAVVFNYVRQLKKYSQSAAQFSTHQPIVPPPFRTPEQSLSTLTEPVETAITLVADNEKDILTLNSDDLLYVESSDNYCTVVYRKNGQAQKTLLRSSLSRLASQINRSNIVRCHRSYLVNLDRVERVTGNAQGYKLHLLGSQFQVPVARQYNDKLVTGMKSPLGS